MEPLEPPLDLLLLEIIIIVIEFSIFPMCTESMQEVGVHIFHLDETGTRG